MILLFSVFTMGSFFPMGREEAEELTKRLEEIIGENVEVQIFLNNFMIAVLGCIPFIGPCIMGYTIFNTGRYLGWISAQTGVPVIVSIFFTIIMVYGLLEFMGYGLATAESLTISYQILRARHLLKREVKFLLIALGLSAALLLAAAFVEGALIRVLEAFSSIITEYP
ncbi:MAG: stage II sporulation protein M [Nitrososphaeria archaeon]|nr:stage II sporulation protein M [Aigarchaeota archaeon]MCX8187350.1 stage II sporulation protein M [Nitrososphaeria archaeon]MDW8021116.1 stage II sporulation protein M [Nitrososphaerota archaeon]